MNQEDEEFLGAMKKDAQCLLGSDDWLRTSDVRRLLTIIAFLREECGKLRDRLEAMNYDLLRQKNELTEEMMTKKEHQDICASLLDWKEKTYAKLDAALKECAEWKERYEKAMGEAKGEGKPWRVSPKTCCPGCGWKLDHCRCECLRQETEP